MIRFARLLVLLPLLWVEGAWAVSCADVDYDLTSQAEVDALGATRCDSIGGNLMIRNITLIAQSVQWVVFTWCIPFLPLKRIQFRIERVGVYRKPVLLLIDFEGGL